MILNPYSFKDVTFSIATGYIAEEMDISSGVADLRIRPVAGGRLFDFNYGERADIIPAPFTVRIFLSVVGATTLQAMYEELASPAVLQGIVGWTDTFTAKDANGASWTCTAGCERVDKILSGDDAITGTTILDGIAISFVPVTNWVKL